MYQRSTISQLIQADPILEKISLLIPMPFVQSTNDVFFDLMSCLIEQQIHYRSTKKTFQKLLGKAGLTTLTPANFNLFEERALGSANLSLSKYETIGQTLDFWAAEKVDWAQLTDDEVRSKLSAIKGVGRWTVDMILLYTLQRPNVFPSDDFHLKQVMTELYGLTTNTRLKAQMQAVAVQWGNHTSVAVLYLLAWKEYNKKRQQR